MGFLLGFIVGLVVSPLLLAVFSKPLMKWIVKKQASKLMQNIGGRLSGLQNQIQITNKDGKQEDSEIRKDRSSKRTSSSAS